VKNCCHILLIYPSNHQEPPPALIMSFYNNDGDPETIVVGEGGLLELECKTSLSSSLLLPLRRWGKRQWWSDAVHTRNSHRA